MCVYRVLTPLQANARASVLAEEEKKDKDRAVSFASAAPLDSRTPPSVCVCDVRYVCV